MSCDGNHPGREAKVGPYQPGMCRLCYLRLNGGRPYAERTPLPCVHAGPATNEIRSCQACNSTTEVQLFRCAKFGIRTLDHKLPDVACCKGCLSYAPDTYSLVAPTGTKDVVMRWEGRLARKPWHYRVSAVIPHLNTLEPLCLVATVLRFQTETPYIIVVDTGSPPSVCAELEKLRAEDLEIHYLKGHGYIQSSAPVSCAQDVGAAMCRTEYMYCTHTDVFLKKRDFLWRLMSMCNAQTPVVGYEMSPRSWATDMWQGMVGHTATMVHVPTIRTLGVHWNMEHGYKLAGWEGKNANGWPDTETGFNLMLRQHGIKPLLIGKEDNFRFGSNEELDHARSYTGARAYNAEWIGDTENWMRQALASARDRVRRWTLGE